MTSVATVRNNGGGTRQPLLFWQIMKPKGGGDPTGPIADAIKKASATSKVFQEKFNARRALPSSAADGLGWSATPKAK